MKFILEFQQKSIEIDLDVKGQDKLQLTDMLKERAKELMPELEGKEIEIVQSEFEIINRSETGEEKEGEEEEVIDNEIDIVEVPHYVEIQIVEENWSMIKKNSEMNVLNEVCKSAKNIHIETYTLEVHKQVRDDLIVSFQPYYSFFADKLSNIQSKNASDMNHIFIEIINSIHSTIDEFNFTGAYIVKLCCDYLTPTFHMTLNSLPSNLAKHKQEFINFVDEHLFDIVTGAYLKDIKKIEMLVEGHNITVHRERGEDWNHRINKIISKPHLRRSNSTDKACYHKEESVVQQDSDQFYSDFNFEITKLKFKMRCELYAESWISIQVLKRVYADQNDEFEKLQGLQDECAKTINMRQSNYLERLVIKSMDLTFEELMNEIEMLVLPEESKSILLIQLYSLRPQVDIKIPDYVREKHKSLLSQGDFAVNSVQKHDKKISCLCLDGGGIRGIIQLILLTELENLTKKKCSELFDFFAGTSIGGIISLALACGHSAQSLLYKFIGNTKNHIFSSRHYIRYLIGVKPDGDDSQFNFSLYNKEGIESELLDFFSDLELDQLNSNVLITSCEIQNNELLPVVFTKLNGICGKQNIIGIHPQLEIDQNYSTVKVRDIARASSAAYPFFAATVINGIPFVDGGFLFNNVDILVTTYLLGHGYQKSNIKMLSLGNAPKEIASSSHGLEHARTAILGLVNCLKGVVNPETYYEQYFAMANLNLDHSLVETKSLLKDNYLRLEPDYHGQFISLDSVTPDAINKLKMIGTNWVTLLTQNSTFKAICEVVLDSRVQIKNEDQSIIIMPRYYSYTDSYASIEEALKDNDEAKWKCSLMNFAFSDASQQIVEPRSFMKTIRYYIGNTQYEDHELLNRASAIGHVPSMIRLFEKKDMKERKELILKESINYWNALHFAAANGEIASFVYLLSVLLETDLFLPKTNNLIPERVKKCLSNIQWISIRQNIKAFLNDKMSKNLPYSNVYGPVFNFHQVDTLHLAIENNQIAFEKLISQILSD